ALVLLFVGIIWADYFRAITGRRSPSGAIALGLGFGFLAILVHSFTDFGQHIAGNAILTAVTCGLVISVARLRGRELGLEHAPPTFRGWAVLRWAVGIVVVAIAGLMIFDADRVRLAESAFARAH